MAIAAQITTEQERISALSLDDVLKEILLRGKNFYRIKRAFLKLKAIRSGNGQQFYIDRAKFNKQFSGALCVKSTAFGSAGSTSKTKICL